MSLRSEDFQVVLDRILTEAEVLGRSSVEIKSGDLHRKVGGYPGTNHRMPICCQVMKNNMMFGDKIMEQPPSGKGATLLISYQLPRSESKRYIPPLKNAKKTVSRRNPQISPSQRTTHSSSITGSLGLVSCTSKKANRPCKAVEMYWPSAFFRKIYTYAKENNQHVGILSAKYGFLLPENIIEPYDISLNDMPTHLKRKWSVKVLNQLTKWINPSEINTINFYAGKNYRSLLIPELEALGFRTSTPLGKLRIGEQMHWINRELGRIV